LGLLGCDKAVDELPPNGLLELPGSVGGFGPAAPNRDPGLPSFDAGSGDTPDGWLVSGNDDDAR